MSNVVLKHVTFDQIRIFTFIYIYILKGRYSHIQKFTTQYFHYIIERNISKYELTEVTRMLNHIIDNIKWIGKHNLNPFQFLLHHLH